jgi:hypothetical protein
MHRLCCCGGYGPAAFISIGPDESDSNGGPAEWGDFWHGDCSPFCLMDEDIIHPVVEADQYEIDNEFVYEEEDDEGNIIRKVRIGYEAVVHPDWESGFGGCFPRCRTEGNGAQCLWEPPQCYDLPFLTKTVTYLTACEGLPGNSFGDPAVGIASLVDWLFDGIINRFGPQILSDGKMNPFPTQVWIDIDVSGSHTWTEGKPIVQGLYNKFVEEYGEEIAQHKFNPCWDGPNCVAWGCCEVPGDCGASSCSTFGEGNIRRYTVAMGNENYVSALVGLMWSHFLGNHCDSAKEAECGGSCTYGNNTPECESCWGD